MKSIQKSLCLLLCFFILLGCAGCISDPAPIKLDLAPSRNENAVALYKSACANIRSARHWKLNIVSEKTITFPGDFYKESCVQSLAYHDYGADSMLAHCSAIYTLGESRIYQEEFYQNGTLYTSINGNRFSGIISGDAFIGQFVPAILISDENYQGVYMESTHDGVKITFGDALAPEFWCHIDADAMNSASGYIVLDANGALTESCYSVSYNYGGAEICESVTTHFYTIQPYSVKQVDSPESYLEISHPKAPAHLEITAGLLAQSNSVSSFIRETSSGEAIDIHYECATDVQMNQANTDLSAEISYQSTLIDYSRGGESITTYQSEQFQNGAYSYKDSDGNLQTDTTVTAQIMKEYILNLLVQNIAMPSHIVASETSFSETAETVTFTLDEEIAQQLKQYTCNSLSVDPVLIDSLSQSYRTNAAICTFILDTTTGLPIELRIQYEGEHVIEGQSYLLSYELNQSFTFGIVY